MAHSTSETLMTAAYLILGAIVIIFVLVPSISKVRNLLLEKEECATPLEMLTNEITDRVEHTDETSELIIPLDLSEQCAIELDDGKLCVYHNGKYVKCIKPDKGTVGGYFVLQGQPGLGRVKISVEKKGGESLVTLSDESR